MLKTWEIFKTNIGAYTVKHLGKFWKLRDVYTPQNLFWLLWHIGALNGFKIESRDEGIDLVESREEQPVEGVCGVILRYDAAHPGGNRISVDIKQAQTDESEGAGGSGCPHFWLHHILWLQLRECRFVRRAKFVCWRLCHLQGNMRQMSAAD